MTINAKHGKGGNDIASVARVVNQSQLFEIYRTGKTGKGGEGRHIARAYIHRYTIIYITLSRIQNTLTTLATHAISKTINYLLLFLALATRIPPLPAHNSGPACGRYMPDICNQIIRYTIMSTADTHLKGGGACGVR